ncbi:RICIN domain-containing protein [Arthrobacter sp. ISL-69]|nr:RICIN domain-containing protein [Arthrobacter sp. ISL-69]
MKQGNCNGNSNQAWQLSSSGSGYEIINVNSGKCLAPEGGSTSPAPLLSQSRPKGRRVCPIAPS